MNLNVDVFRKILAGLVISISSALCAQTLEIIPASPKGLETVRARAPNAVGGARVKSTSMSANKISVMIVGPEISPSVPIPRGPIDVVLGQLPAGTYTVEAFESIGLALNLLGTTQFAVADQNIGRPNNAPQYNWTDLWWVASESGWGINITVKNDKFFAAWFVYDGAGKAAWYTFQGGDWNNGGICYSGPIVKSTGPAWGGILGLTSINYSQAGTGNLCFLVAGTAPIPSYDTATFTYTVEGMTNTKILARQPF